MTRVVFFFDVMSPYTYLAFQVLKRYRSLWKLEVDFRPFFLGGIMKGSGNQPPAFVPAKASFLAKDMRRNIEWFKLKQVWQGHPVNFFQDLPKISLGISRLLCVAIADESLSVDAKWNLIDAAFQILWEAKEYRSADNEFILPAREEGLMKDLVKRSGVGLAESLIQRSNTEGRESLRQHTDRALELKAFGSPVFLFDSPSSPDKHLFFGSDRFEQIAHLFNLPWYGPNPDRSRL